ncbi:MAG: hypothetical protein IJT82_03670 [Schwartzia sp.]|nr:hypothetical protein [Schwartzia sp. (in: firmicutes)]
MLTTNTMRYGTDEFASRKQARLEAKSPWNTAGQTNIEGFEVASSIPADSNVRLIFKVDGAYHVFDSSHAPVAYTGADDIDGILENGNTPDELADVTDISSWIGKEIYPVIVLDASPEATVMPKVKISLKVRNNQDKFEMSEESAEYSLVYDEETGTLPKIISCVAELGDEGQGSTTVQASIKGADGTWSEYMSLANIANITASAIKYKASYAVQTINGDDTAKVRSVTLRYASGETSVSGDTAAEIYTVTQSYAEGLGYCNVLVKHKKLKNAIMDAYVAFKSETSKREMIQIGMGTGERQTLTLGVDNVADTGINHASIKIYVNSRNYVGFSYNTETSEVTLTAEAGAAISASYEYGWEQETWNKMTLQNTEPYQGSSTMCASRFAYTLPSDAGTKTVSNVKLVISRPTGIVEDELLGIATGSKQAFVLPYAASKDTIQCTGSWSYDEDTQIITVVAARDTEIRISYTWTAENPAIYGMTVGWAIAA